MASRQLQVRLTLVQAQCAQALLQIRHRNLRPYMRNIWQRRRKYSEYFHLFKELTLEDTDTDFINYIGVNPQQFKFLLGKVEQKLYHEKTHRIPISAAERLTMTLKFLASGDSQHSISERYRVGKSTVGEIIKETCDAIWDALQPEYVAAPEQWKEISMEFRDRWNFPNCLGAIDGKHIVIRAPPKSGSLFYNYKNTFSVVLLAVVDGHYRFSLVDVGAPGRHSDGGVLAHSAFGQALEAKKLNLPDCARLQGSQTVLPYYFVGDEAFPLKEKMMRPFPGRELNEERKIFNYRLSRARRIVENAFGILSARWRVLLGPIDAAPAKVAAIVKAVIALHNYLRTEDMRKLPQAQTYAPANFVDEEDSSGMVVDGAWRTEVRGRELESIGPQDDSELCIREAIQVRQELAAYLSSPAGSVPWQWRTVRRHGDTRDQ